MINTADRINPALPDMSETLQIMGHLPYQLVNQISYIINKALKIIFKSTYPLLQLRHAKITPACHRALKLDSVDPETRQPTPPLTYPPQKK